MAKIKKVGHVVLGVRDPARSIKFYTEVPGRLKHPGARVEFTADYVLTKSVYFFDPDGNRLEIFSQELPSAGAKQYLHEARTAADVMRLLDLEMATSVGGASNGEPV